MSKYVKGLAKLLKQLEATKKRHKKGSERGLKKAGLALLRGSLDEVPVDASLGSAAGTLRASGYAGPVTEDGDRMIMPVGYTDEKALMVHEILENAHGREFNIKHAEEIAAGKEVPRGEEQKAKFLTDPLREMHDELMKLIKEEISK